MKVTGVVFILSAIVPAFCCPDGWETHLESCYHFSHDSEDWIGAEETCRIVFDAHLVEINSPEENLYLETQARKQNKTYWIGLNDLLKDGTWYWVGSKQPLKATGFADWAPGEPNNYVGEESCALLYQPLRFRWTDAPCNWNAPHYICEKKDSDAMPVG